MNVVDYAGRITDHILLQGYKYHLCITVLYPEEGVCADPVDEGVILG